MKEPIRVAHIMGKMAAGGVESAVMNYYRNIDRQKVQFDFIIDEDSTIVPYEEIESLGGNVYKVPPYQKPFAYHKALVKLFSEKKYCIVHSHINTLSVFPLFAAKRAAVPVRIAHSHSTAGKGEFKRNVIKYLLRPFSKIFPTHFCACSEYAGQWLFGKKKNIVIVKNAIDISKFTFNPQTRQTTREKLGIENNFVVGHVGRFMKQKNHSFLLDIFQKIHIKNPASVLLLIGEGELEQEIKNKVERLKLTDFVRFMGVRDDVYNLLQAMDIFLFPSLYEGLGSVAIEAQAVGLSVIASDKVPNEAKISERLVNIPLNLPAEEWAEKILSLPLNPRESPTKQIIASGYEIKVAAVELFNMYAVRGEA